MKPETASEDRATLKTLALLIHAQASACSAYLAARGGPHENDAFHLFAESIAVRREFETVEAGRGPEPEKHVLARVADLAEFIQRQLGGYEDEHEKRARESTP